VSERGDSLRVEFPEHLDISEHLSQLLRKAGDVRVRQLEPGEVGDLADLFGGKGV
jgi:hypothetical protein